MDVVNHWWGFQNWVDARQGVQRQSAPSRPEEVVGLQSEKPRSPQLVFDLANE
ncbi:hypothetical protein D3C73_1497640 [compost metagenome]